MKRVFVSHPFRSDPEGNMKKIRLIEKRLAALGIAYFSPLSNYQTLDDVDAKQRDFALKCCAEWIPQNDELWLFDEWENSEGCQDEHLTALLELVTIRIVIGWTEDELPIFAGESPKWLRREI